MFTKLFGTYYQAGYRNVLQVSSEKRDRLEAYVTSNHHENMSI